MHELRRIDVHQRLVKTAGVVPLSQNLSLSLNPLRMVPVIVVPLCPKRSRSRIQGPVAQPAEYVILVARKLNIGEFILRHSVKSWRQVLLAIVYND
jgi:hypothetical protein